MLSNKSYPNFVTLLSRPPQAWAKIRGSERYPEIEGNLRFYQTSYGVLVVSEVKGLPLKNTVCSEPIFALHIHEGTSCTGNADDPFADALTHYNPKGCPHPYHAGDLPPLFGAGGYAYSVVLSDRFTVREIVGKTVILHASLDDFTTQPSGNAGMKMACGVVME